VNERGFPRQNFLSATVHSPEAASKAEKLNLLLHFLVDDIPEVGTKAGSIFTFHRPLQFINAPIAETIISG
jgi:hypothetical protein